VALHQMDSCTGKTVQVNERHALMCLTTFKIYQLGYQLNLKHVTVQFNVTTHSRQKTLIVYIINEQCKLLHVMPKKLCPKNDTQKLTLVVFPKQSHKLQMTGHTYSYF